MTDNSFYLKALLNSDENAIKEIYNNNFYKIKSFVLKNKGQKEDAEDVFQKALLQLTLRYKREEFVITSSFEAYLYTACKNLWRRELNKSKIKVTKYGIVEREDENEDLAMAILEQKRWELFAETLELISEKCRHVLKLYFDDTPYAEMVKQFNYSSESVARQSVFKCKNRLKDLVKKDKRYNALSKL